jgi:hypothetical protein
MKQNRRDNDLKRAVQFVEEGESRIAKQRELIAALKNNRRPTKRAEAVLLSMENSLLHMRNYLAILLELRRRD